MPAPLILSRRTFTGASATALLAALVANRTSLSAQRMDPYTYMKPMEATTDIGQVVGQAADEVEVITAADQQWNAFIQIPIKEGQYFHYTCEFDSAEIILRAYGSQLTLDEQVDIVGIDNPFEPWAEWVGDTVAIYGGDIQEHFSGHLNENIVSRSRCSALRKVFDHEQLAVTVVKTQEEISEALLRGEPVFFKSTVDFLDWDPSIWHTPDGDEFPCVYTNDHALVLMGFNDDHVIVRDPLGPTSTNETRPWQYYVPWERYLDVIEAQGTDAIAIGPRMDGATPPS